jgi:hypothetical protein
MRHKVDAAALAVFHTGAFMVAIVSIRKDVAIYAILAACVLGLDIVYSSYPPKRRAIPEREPKSTNPEPKPEFRTFAFEYFVLFAPPVIFVLWLFSLIWDNHTLTRNELLATIAIMPIVVGLVSWIIYWRMTRCHRGIRNSATQLIAFSMLGTWTGSTFVFVVLIVGLLSR